MPFTCISRLTAQAGEAEKAEMLLHTMGDTGLMPDAHSFTGVIAGFANAAQPEKAAKVHSQTLPLWAGTQLHAARCTLHAARCTLHAARCVHACS